MKKILAGILAAVTFATCVCTMISCTKEETSESAGVEMKEEIKNDENFALGEVASTAGMSLKVERMSFNNPMAPETGVMQTSLEWYELTATVLPEDAEDKTVTYSVAWENAESAWAKGKNVNDFVTLKQEITGSLTAALTCIQAFGEPIIVTVVSNNNANAKATATLHFKQKANLVTADFGGGGNYYYGDMTDYIYKDGEDSLTGYYKIGNDGANSFSVLIGGSSTYTRALECEGFVEVVPTEEFSSLMQSLGKTVEGFTAAANTPISYNDFWSKTYMNTLFPDAEAYNAAVQKLYEVEGEYASYTINVYTKEGGEKLSTFNLIFDCGALLKRVQSVSLDYVEIEF